MFGLLEQMCSLPCVACLICHEFDSIWGFDRKWLEYWFSGVFVSCVPRNAVIYVWLHSLLNSRDFGIWHASFGM